MANAGPAAGQDVRIASALADSGQRAVHCNDAAVRVTRTNSGAFVDSDALDSAISRLWRLHKAFRRFARRPCSGGERGVQLGERLGPPFLAG
jgi:hypothetical protein